MDSSRRDRSIGFLCLVVTAFGWALNWPLMKLLLQQWPPLFARGLAGTLAAVILAALALSRRESLKVPREAVPRLLFATFTNVFAWMGFGTMAMKYVTVGEGALLAYTMPIWAMLFAWPFLRVRPGLRDVAALGLGIAGVADRKSTRLNSSHVAISYAVFCLKKKKDNTLILIHVEKTENVIKNN